MGLRGTTLALGAVLLAVGLLAASPFLNRGLVGTGEAYNYSLGVADAVQQLRHGDTPPLAGQTEYAFNGRIHPLRNAPYLFYLAAAIDAATLHRLAPWQLQNASLVLSLVAAVLGCYAALRWATGCPPVLAALLASLYGLSSPLLCAAHQLDLFMTVHAAVFVPLAVAAAVKGCRQPSFSADAALAAALAAAWLAHPPVALWLTFSLLLVRLVHFALRPSWPVFASGCCGLLLAGALAAFVFASVASLNADLGFFGDATLYRNFADVIMVGVHSTFPASLLPVSRSAQATGDLQFGYVPWILTLGCLVLAFCQLRRSGSAVAPIVLSVAALLLLLLQPVPGLTWLLWHLVPGQVLTLTTEWPMQRLYLVALGLGVFGTALVLPDYLRQRPRPLWHLVACAALALAWTGYQAVPFLRLGYANRWTLATTQEAYQPSNLNLTVTSYAFLGLPPTFNHGVIDPALEFRILQDGKDEVASNLSAAFTGSPVILQGPITAVHGMPGTAESKPITLLPGHKYLLTFTFKTPPFKGILSIAGTAVHRYYGLPEAGERYGFGMRDGQRKTIPIWTDAAKPEKVVIGLAAEGAAGVPKALVDFADFSLQDVDMKSLPVRLESLLPMRLTIDQPQPECTVETPRRFLSGYRATVNGLEVTPLISPARQVMVPIPAGHSVVELRYVGARSAHVAFWVSAVSWLLFLAWRLAGSPLPDRPLERTTRATRAGARWAWRYSPFLLAMAAGLGVLGYFQAKARQERAYLAAVGPIRIDFKLPYRQQGINQPLLATGHPGAGVIIFAVILDGKHIRVGADVWGSLYQSALLPVDFFRVQTLVVSDSALFPLSHPAVQALNEVDREKLRGELRVELNGKVIILAKCSAYETTMAETQVGHAGMGSLTGPDFLGEVVGQRRLVVPQTITLPTSDHLEMNVRLPVLAPGEAQPLFSLVCGAHALTCSVEPVDGRQVRLATLTSAGTRAESPPFDAGPAAEHRLEIQPEDADAPGRPFGLSVLLDGRQVLGHPTELTPATPSVVITGLDQNATPGDVVRFMGPLLSTRLVPNANASPDAVTMSLLHLVLTFPTGKNGRHEPILTTGHSGAGDLVYVVYDDDHHVRLGVDHWGGAGGLSAPIKVDYLQPHEVWVRSGALYPSSPDDPAWHGIAVKEQAALKGKIEVILDGMAVLVTPVSAHPTTAAEITVVHNRIGMSTADPDFSGRLEFYERTAVAPPAD